MRRCGLLSASVVLLACALLVSCAKNGYPPADVSEPFVTWDGESTIPFIYSVDNTFFLGVWDVEHGKVSFDESPPFSLDGQSSQLSWDGGDRFAFAGTEVTKRDPRVRIENLDAPASSSWAGPGYLLARFATRYGHPGTGSHRSGSIRGGRVLSDLP